MTLDRAIKKFNEMIDSNASNDNISECFKIACQAIKEKIERDNPKSLTLHELMNMKGEAIWLVNFFGNYEACDGKWAILFGYEKTNGNFLFTNSVGIHHVYNEEKYGESWVAYKHKPKGAK